MYVLKIDSAVPLCLYVTEYYAETLEYFVDKERTVIPVRGVLVYDPTA